METNEGQPSQRSILFVRERHGKDRALNLSCKAAEASTSQRTAEDLVHD